MANHDNFTHDVFLSFRGKTRYAFTDHLYRSLLRHEINVFRDDQNLEIGNEIGPSLLHAIEGSRISIVVLCRDYASSTWCLDELVKIVDCYYEMKGRAVLVLFYKVEPSDVRYQRNSYQVAMVEHEKRFGSESEKVKAWRLALKRVSALSGLHCKEDSYESEFIEKIARDISAKLTPMPLQSKQLVRLDSRFEQTAFTTKKDYGREEREAQWATAQRTLHGLQSPETTNIINDKNSYRELSEIAEEAKRRAEIARLRELHTLKGHVESVVKLKGLDIDMQQHYTV